ncbi:MAG: LLM class flavin-dependent oxidoreductase [Solirubrobacteraceae bacterium]
MTRFWFAASTEEFLPSQMLEQARAAEAAGFDAVGCSDHFAPWWPDGAATQAWVTLAAIGQQTTRPLFTAVTPIIHHYHPGVVAQAWMALEELYPGRAILGVGSGEALNEVPLGLDWPEPGEMLNRFEKGLEAITRLWDGETVTMDGGWFRLRDAKLYTRAPGRPRMIVSAFGPQARDRLVAQVEGHAARRVLPRELPRPRRDARDRRRADQRRGSPRTGSSSAPIPPSTSSACGRSRPSTAPPRCACSRSATPTRSARSAATARPCCRSCAESGLVLAERAREIPRARGRDDARR